MERKMIKSKAQQVRQKNSYFSTVHMFLLMCLLFGLSEKLQGQEKMSNQYAWFDSMTGQTNSGIFKGVVYDKEVQVVNDKHQFFKSSDHLVGDIVVNNQPYFGQQLRYDVFNDLIIINNFEANGLPEIIVDKNKVSTFQIGNHVFKKVDSLSNKEAKLSSFVEVLLSNDTISLLKKHQKKKIKKTEDKLVSYKFKEHPKYFIRNDNHYYEIKRVADLTALFPQHKKFIKEIQEMHSSLKKLDEDRYFKAIVLDIIAELKPNSTKQ